MSNFETVWQILWNVLLLKSPTFQVPLKGNICYIQISQTSPAVVVVASERNRSTSCKFFEPTRYNQKDIMKI